MIEAHARGAVLAVRAQAGARRNAILGTHDGMLRVAVTAAPEKGKANKAIAELLSKKLGVPKSAIELIRGATSPQKQFLIEGMSPQQLETAIRSILGESD